MKVTINIPSLSTLTRAVKSVWPNSEPRSVRSAFTRNCGAYHDRQNDIWLSYLKINDKVYVVQPPEGVNARDYAEHLKADNVVPHDSFNYDAACDRCAGTGKRYGQKCYRCDGKGWISPIDQARYAAYLERKASATPAS